MALKKTIIIDVNSSGAEKKLKGLDKQVKTTSKTATQTGKGLSGAFSGMGAAISGTIPMLGKLKAALISTGIGALVVAVGALVGMFTSALNKGAEFEKGLSTLKAVSGGTEAELGKLAGQAKELGSTTQFTAIEVVKLQTELAKLGFTASDIGNSTPAILSLASSLEVDLASAAELAGSTVRAFGLTTDDTAKVVDVMALSTSSSALNFEALRESIKIVAPAARATGVSIEKTAALLGVLANNGLKGSVAGTGLSKSFIELNKKGITLEEGMAKVAGSSNKLNTAIELVGVVGAKSFLSLAESGKEIAELETTFNNASGAADRMAAIRLDNLDGDLTKLSSAWEGLQLSIESGDGALAKFARSVIQSVTSITSFFTATEDATEALSDEQMELFKVEAQINSLNVGTKGRTELIKDLQKRYPAYLNNINAETVTNGNLAKQLKKVNNMLMNKIILAKQDAKMEEQAQVHAETKMRQMKQEDKVLKTIAQNRAVFGEILKDVDMTGDYAQQMKAQSKALSDYYRSAESDSDSAGRRMSLKSAIRSNEFVVNSLKGHDKFLETQQAATDNMAKEREELMKRLGVNLQESAVITTDKVKDIYKNSRPDATDEEKEAANKAAKEREAALKKSQKELANIIKKTNKSAEDLEDESELEKAQRKRERALKELEDVKLDVTKKAEAKIAINNYYDDLEIVALQKDRDARKVIQDKIDKENSVKRVEELELQKDFEDLSFQEQRDLLKEREAALLLDKVFFKSLTNEQLLELEKSYSDASVEITKNENQAKQEALNSYAGALSSISGVLGQETQAGKGIAIASSLVNTYASIAGQLNAFSGIPVPGYAIAQAIATGVVGFANVKKIASVKIPNSKGGGGGAGAGSLPSAGAASQPPSFNIVGASESSQLADAIGGQSQQPVQAYVVSNDVTTAQSLQNNIVEGATIG